MVGGGRARGRDGLGLFCFFGAGSAAGAAGSPYR